MELKDLKPGDEVLLRHHPYTSHGLTIKIVKKVSRTGQVTLENGQRFTSRGSAIGYSDRCAPRIQVLTPELRQHTLLLLQQKRLATKYALLHECLKLKQFVGSLENEIKFLEATIPFLQAALNARTAAIESLTAPPAVPTPTPDPLPPAAGSDL